MRRPDRAAANLCAVTLPGKRFFDPLAAALIEMRRDLLWSRANAPAHGADPEGGDPSSPKTSSATSAPICGCAWHCGNWRPKPQTLTPETRDEMAEALWEIALLVEEGDLASAQERLHRAQDRLDEAIRNGADPAEIDELMQEMREALNDYMRQLAEEAQRNPDSQMSRKSAGHGDDRRPVASRCWTSCNS